MYEVIVILRLWFFNLVYGRRGIEIWVFNLEVGFDFFIIKCKVNI